MFYADLNKLIKDEKYDFTGSSELWRLIFFLSYANIVLFCVLKSAPSYHLLFSAPLCY